MKTKALLLTLMVLTMWSCSNDDNGTTEEQEEEQEQVVMKLKKFTRDIQYGGYPDDVEKIEYFFDESGNLTEIDMKFWNYTRQYVFHYNGQNQLIKRVSYENYEIAPNIYDLVYIYDDQNKLEKIDYIGSSGNVSWTLEFQYSNNLIRTDLFAINHYMGSLEYRFHNNNLIEVKEIMNGVEYIRYRYEFLGNNMVKYIISADIDHVYEFQYDDKINPLSELTKNKFFYVTNGLPEEGMPFGLPFASTNNFASFIFTKNTGEVYESENQVEYNEFGYPVYAEWVDIDNEIHEYREKFYYEYY